MASRETMVGLIGSLLLIAIGIFGGALVSEAGYRLWLWSQQPEQFVQRIDQGPLPVFGVYDASHWEFDRDFGYVYPPGRVINLSHVGDGVLSPGCTRLEAINERGNIGVIEGTFEDAELKILVFGDSFTAFHVGGVTWPVKLQRKLREELGIEVHVVNFGRDGYGILQMIDLAAAKIEEWQPDLAFVAFITDDLTRARFWRTVTTVDGEERVLTTVDPVPHPDMSRAVDTFIIDAAADREWCLATVGQRDEVVERLEAKYRRARAHSAGGYRVRSIATLRHSYLYNRIRHGDPYRFAMAGAAPATNPRTAIVDYAEDSQFMANLERIQATGIPTYFIHLPHYPEIRAGREYILTPQGEALLESLERLTGQPVLATTDYIEMPVEQPERMNITPENYHPSLWGMNLYADAVTRMVIENRMVPESIPARAELPAHDRQR